MRKATRVGVLAIAGLLLTTMASAADETKAFGPFAVDRAVLQGLAGTLEVRVAEGTETRLSISGPADAVAALGVEAAAGTLRVTAPERGHSVTVVDRVTVVTGSGATSNVVIGGSSAASASSRNATGAPLDVVLDLPEGTRLELLGFTGDAEIGDLAGPVAIEAIGGTVRIGAVTAAVFAAVGDGSIEAASVEGDLETSVTGAGRIAVRSGHVGAVTVDVIGAGVVEIDAPAASAVVNMVGDGRVRLVEVAGDPEVSRVGAGQFSVGSP
jgi:hypothetical protein